MSDGGFDGSGHEFERLGTEARKSNIVNELLLKYVQGITQEYPQFCPMKALATSPTPSKVTVL